MQKIGQRREEESGKEERIMMSVDGGTEEKYEAQRKTRERKREGRSAREEGGRHPL